MSRGFSRVVLVGNLGRDPEMRYSQTGTPITNFSIAVNRRRRNPDGSHQDETDWYRITFYRQQAEWAAEWLKKGSKVLVEGQLRIRTFTGQDGVERTSVEVEGDNFMNLTSRDEQAMLGGDQSYRSNQGGDQSFRSNQGGGNQSSGYGGDSSGNFSQRQPAPRGGGRPAAANDDDPFDDLDLDDVPF